MFLNCSPHNVHPSDSKLKTQHVVLLCVQKGRKCCIISDEVFIFWFIHLLPEIAQSTDGSANLLMPPQPTCQTYGERSTSVQSKGFKVIRINRFMQSDSRIVMIAAHGNTI